MHTVVQKIGVHRQPKHTQFDFSSQALTQTFNVQVQGGGSIFCTATHQKGYLNQITTSERGTKVAHQKGELNQSE